MQEKLENIVYLLSLALLCAGLPPTIYDITQDSLEESGVTLVWHNGQKSKIT